MPAPGIGQPAGIGTLTFNIFEVKVDEVPPGPASPNIVPPGSSITLTTILELTGSLAGVAGPAVTAPGAAVFHHPQRLEDGAMGPTLASGPITPIAVPPGGDPAGLYFSSITAPILTGVAGSGAPLSMAPGFAAGTFRLMTHYHGAAGTILRALHDLTLVEVTP